MVKMDLFKLFQLITEEESCINILLGKEFNNKKTALKIGKFAMELTDVYLKQIKPKHDEFLAISKDGTRKEEASKGFYDFLKSNEVEFDFIPLNINDFEDDTLSPNIIYSMLVLGLYVEE